MYSAAEQKQLFELSKAYLEQQNIPTDVDEQLAQLRQILQYHEHRYYLLNEPVIGDAEYDQLYKQLEKLERQYPELVTPDSPTQRVGSDLEGDFQAVPHLVPMLSLGNSYNADDLLEFDRQLKRMLNMPESAEIAYAVEPKFDGGSIALVYEDDQLQRAATRGNGTEGEEITANARVMRSIPLQAAFSQYGLRKVELRGEVIIRKDKFEAINAARAAKGESLYANPRNTATGGLRMKSPAEVAQRGMETFVYSLGYAEDHNGRPALDQFASHTEALHALTALGFKVPSYAIERLCAPNIQEAAAFCRKWEAQRNEYAYEIDGMVLKADSLALQERAGYTAHHPRWAIAYKFAAKQATTTLLDVEYQVGKIGTITPVAKTAVVNLAGVNISSISLHNEDFIREKDLHLGDKILIERAGDVIPYIVKALATLRDGSEQPIIWPTNCPINPSSNPPVALIREAGEAAWRCPNCLCGAQELQRINFHVSKVAMDIDGMGKRYVEQFYALGWLQTLPDIYRLPYEQIAQLEGFGEKSAHNLREAVEKAKNNPLWRLLVSLSIHHLGKKASQLLAAQINHALELATWQEADFLAIKDIGPTVANNVIDWFSQADNIALLQTLESLGVNLQATAEDRPKATKSSGPLAGKSILFTGTLTQMSRKEAQEKATAAGARNISAISGSLDILVVGENAGSKLKKAQAIGSITILSETDFLALLEL